jgi:copper oxidase (laccase) domain-containing protein
VHAGWQGTVRGVTTEVVTRMTELGSDPADLIALIGPSIHPDRYQVGHEVRDAARARFGDQVDQVVRPDGTGRWVFDLWTANRLLLLRAGVRPGAVHLGGLDTGPGTPFFSYRSQGRCGRFAVFARIGALR